MRSHLVEPTMAIQRSPEAERYDSLIEQHGRLRQKMDKEGVDSLTSDEKAQLVLVTAMKSRNSMICHRIVHETITGRVDSPKLTQRFLCAIWPPHLNVRPTDGWVMRKARIEALAFYDKNLSDINNAKPKDYTAATVLAGSLAVKKPLSLKKAKPS